MASMIGNAGFNKIFEANLDPAEKIRPDCSTYEIKSNFLIKKF